MALKKISETKMESSKDYASAINSNLKAQGKKGRWATKVGVRGALKVANDPYYAADPEHPVDEVMGVNVTAKKPSKKAK